jgi:hypothetical protein
VLMPYQPLICYIRPKKKYNTAEIGSIIAYVGGLYPMTMRV